MGIKVYTKSKWEAIFEELKENLEKGEYSIGDNFYTIDEICRKFNVSRITAKRVFQELKNEGWILPVRRRGTIVNRSYKQKDIFFIVGSAFIEQHPSEKQDFFVINTLLKGLHTGEKFYNTKVLPIDHIFFFSHINDFVNKDVVMPAQYIYDFREWFGENPSVFECLKSEIRPVLLHASEEIGGFSLTRISYEDGIRLAVEHLISKGHKNIGYISGDINFTSFYLRFKGFTDTLKEHSIRLEIERVKVWTGKKKEKIWELVEELLSLSEPPTGLVCASDVIAINVLEYCNKRGIRVPGELAVTGFDNRAEGAFSKPPLTTVDSKLEEQGRKAVELIIQRATGKISEPVVIRLEPELIVREST